MIDGKKLSNIEKQVESSGKRLGSILDVVKKSLFKNPENQDILGQTLPQTESEDLLSQLEAFEDDDVTLFISDANKNIEAKYNSISLYFDEIAKLVAKLEILIADAPDKDVDISLLEDIKEVVNNFSTNIESLKKIIININFKVVEFEQTQQSADVRHLIDSIRPEILEFDKEFKAIVDTLDEKMKSLLALIKEFDSIDNPLISDERAFNSGISSVIRVLSDIDSKYNLMIKALDSDVDASFDELKISVNSLEKEVLIFKDTLDSVFINGNEELKKIMSEMKAALSEVKVEVGYNLKTSLNTISEDVSSLKEAYSSGDASIKDTLERLYSSMHEIQNNFDDDLKENFKSIEGNNSEVRELINKLYSSLGEIQSDLDDGLRGSLDSIDSNNAEVKELISKLYSSLDTIQSGLGDTLKENLKSISTVNTEVKELMCRVDASLQHIKSNLGDDIKDGIQSLGDEISIIKESLELINPGNTGISDLISRLDSSLDEMREDISAEFSEKIGLLENKVLSFKESLLSVSSDDKLQELIDNLDFSVAEIKRNINTKIEENIKNLNSEISSFKESFVCDNTESKKLLDSLSLSVCDIKNDISEKIKEDLASLTSQVSALSDDKNEVKELIQKLDSSIEEIKSNIDDSDKFEDLYSKVDAALDILSDLSTDSPIELVQSVRESVDDLQKRIDSAYSHAGSQSNDEILALLEDVKSSLVDLEENIGLSESDIMLGVKTSVDEAKDEIKNELVSLDAKIEESFSKVNGIDTQKDLDELKDQVDSIVGELVTQIVSIFDNVSFEEEVEDIKDFIYESSEGIKYDVAQIKNAIFEHKECFEGSSQEDALNEIISKLDKLSDVQKLISGVENGIGNVLSFFQGEKYSLTDVEDDFAKIRLTLNELSRKNEDFEGTLEHISKLSDSLSNLDSINDEQISTIKDSVVDLKYDFQNIAQQFEKLNDDVSNLNMCTNKLILKSEDSTNALRDNLDNFKNMITQSEPDKIQQTLSNMTFALNDSIKLFERRFSEIKQEMSTVSTYSTNNSASLENIKNSFLLLAEWMESAGNVLEELGEDVVGLKEIDYEKFSNEIESFQKNSSLFVEKLSDISSGINDLKKLANASELEDYTSDFEDVKKSLSSISSGILDLSLRFSERSNPSQIDYSQDLQEIKQAAKELMQKEMPQISIPNYQSELNDIKSSIQEALSAKAPNIEIDTDEISDKIEKKIEQAISTRLVQSENRLSVLEDKIDSLLSGLDTLQKKDAMTIRIKALESKIENIDENIQKLVSLMDE